ncbi:hypothetical protein CPB83DRAFT_860538, partial [Crepidotus variabilis]
MLVEYPRRIKRTIKKQPRTPPSSSYSHSPAHTVNFTLSDVVRRITLEQGQRETESCQNVSSFSGLSKLPPELLAEIFTFCLPTDQFHVPSCIEAPLVLTHVSSQWRAIALSTPHLWSSLHINYKDSLEDTLATELWLSRSGTCPLSLSIAIDFNQQAQQEILDVLCRYSTRWKHIRFDFRDLLCPPMYDLDVAFGEVPSLETFEFHARDISDTNITPITSLLESAPQLKEVTWVDDLADTETLLQLPLSQLTRLSLSMENGTLDYLQLLNQCSNLEHIRITRPVANSLNQPSPPPVYLSKLTSLNISYDLTGILDHLILPALRSVRIYSDHDKHPSAHPYTQSMHVQSYPHLPLPSSASSSSTSSSHSSHSVPAWQPTSLLSLIDRSTCSITQLSINAPMTEDALLQCIRRVADSLIKLVVKGVSLGDKLVEALTLSRQSRAGPHGRERTECSRVVNTPTVMNADSETDGSGWCCPRLEDIELDTTLGCVQGVLAALVESRLGVGVGMASSSSQSAVDRSLLARSEVDCSPLRRLRIVDGQKDIGALRDLEAASGLGPPRNRFVLQVIPRKDVKKGSGDCYMFRRKLCASR